LIRFGSDDDRRKISEATTETAIPAAAEVGAMAAPQIINEPASTTQPNS
jgi:hypothetical protein